MGKLVADMTLGEHEKVRERNHQRYIENRQARIEYERERRKQHHEEIAARRHLAYSKNPDKYRKLARDSQARHIDEVRERGRRYFELHRDEINERARIRRANNLSIWHEKERKKRERRKDEINALARVKYSRNPERRRATAYKWRKANPEKASALLNNYRIRRLGNGGTHTPEEWRALLEKYGNKCLCCGRTGIKLTRDHILPVIAGGSGYISNIQPLCRSCNSKKHSYYIDYRPDSYFADWT